MQERNPRQRQCLQTVLCMMYQEPDRGNEYWFTHSSWTATERVLAFAYDVGTHQYGSAIYQVEIELCIIRLNALVLQHLRDRFQLYLFIPHRISVANVKQIQQPILNAFFFRGALRIKLNIETGSSHLSGSNFSGSGQNLGSFCISTVGDMMLSPALYLTPSYSKSFNADRVLNLNANKEEKTSTSRFFLVFTPQKYCRKNFRLQDRNSCTATSKPTRVLNILESRSGYLNHIYKYGRRVTCGMFQAALGQRPMDTFSRPSMTSHHLIVSGAPDYRLPDDP